MRRARLALALALAACGQPEPPPPLPAPPERVTPAAWFICDVINAPALLVFERDGPFVRIAHYDKPNGALVQRSAYQLGATDAGMSTLTTTLLHDGAEAGVIRQINPDMLDTPGAAYTQPFAGVRLGEREARCRWMPYTRLLAFTGRRSIVIHEDGDGDLIYNAYDFPDAAAAQQIELSNNAQTTTFSLELREGREAVSAEGARFEFVNGDVAYRVSAGRNGQGQLIVVRDGVEIQNEPLVAFQLGDGG
jgi:hypothetical protein